MSEFPELSRLPRDPEYWNRLESRITAELNPALRSLGATRMEWWTPLARRVWVLGGLAAAAGLAALLLVPPRATSPAAPPGLLRMPTDPGVLAFVSAPAPPPLASLMLPPARSPR